MFEGPLDIVKCSKITSQPSEDLLSHVLCVLAQSAGNNLIKRGVKAVTSGYVFVAVSLLE